MRQIYDRRDDMRLQQLTYDKPMYEYLMWENCNNNCEFCWQKHLHKDYMHLTMNEKVDCVMKVNDHIENIEQGSDVLIVGGELFDEDTNAIEVLTMKIAKKIKEGQIRFLYVNTNLIYKDLEGLSFSIFQQMQMAGVTDKLKFTTSYDIAGRYKTAYDEKLFLSNLEIITFSYPEVTVTVNMIMTKQFCEAILDGKFDIKAFCDKYKVGFNTIPYIILKDDLTATKDQIYNTLLYIDKIYPGYLKSYIENLDLQQEKKLFEYNKYSASLEECTADVADCNHMINFNRVYDDKSCFICDLKDFYNSMF